MSKAIQRFSLDVTHPDVQASVRIMQGDDNRQWRFTFTEAGRPFILPARCTAMLVGTKPDDTVIENGLVVQGNEVIYDFGAADPENGIEQISTVPGSFEVQILLFDEYGAVLHAPRLWVTVFSSSYTERMANVSMDQFGGIKELIARLVGAEVSLEKLLGLMTSQGTVTIAPTQWTNTTPFRADVFMPGDVFGKGCVVLFAPEDDATKEAAGKAMLSMTIGGTVDYNAPTPDYVVIARAEGGEAPTIPLNFRYIVLKTGTEDKALVAMVGVDAVGAGGTGGTGGVDEDAVRSVINQVVPEWARKATPPEDAVKSVNGKTGDVNIPIPEVSKNAVGLGNVANERQYSEANPPPYPVKSVNGKTGAVSLGASDVGARPSTWTPTAAQVGADPAGTAATKVSDHDTYTGAHNDIRLMIKALQEQVNKFLDVDDTTRDELSEVLALIDANAGTLESLTSSKVNVADIINNLTTNVTNKPLSAAQGVALKALIDALSTGKLDASALNSAITTALAQAKASGDFKGDPGTSVTIKSISESDESGGENVVTFSDGKTLKVKNGKDGEDGGSGTYIVPAYWESAVDEAITKVKALQDGGGNDVVNFCWFSDIHYGGDKSYTGNVGVLCAAVMDACDIPLTLMNGDTLTASACGSEELALSLIETAKEIYAPIGYDRLMLVSGNHDDVYGTSGGVSFVNKIAPEKIWNALYRPQSKDFRRVFGGNGTYFYLDNIPQKVRFVCLNGHYYDGEEITNGTTKMMSFGYGTEQLSWVENVALSVEDGWSVVIATHTPPIAEYKSHFTDTSYDEIRRIITNADAEIIGVFCGHMHRSNIYTDDLPCPIITVTCAVNTPYDGTTAERVAGTVTETSIDVVSINKATKTINMTRIGHGSDRVIGYGGTEIVTYSVKNNLTNCTNSNTATVIEKGSAYSATITAKSGYVLDSVSVTMGGSAVAVADGAINIASVTGDIVITATATEEVVEPTYTNLFDKNKVLLNARYNSSRTVVEQNGMFITGRYAVPSDFATKDCYLYVKGVNVTANNNVKIGLSNNSTLNTPALGDVIEPSALQFNVTTNLGAKWETLDAASHYYKIDLRRNGQGNVHSYVSQVKAFDFTVYVGTTVLTASSLPDIIMSFEPIE